MLKKDWVLLLMLLHSLYMFHLIENTAVTFKALTQTPAELVGVVVGAVFFFDFAGLLQGKPDSMGC